jgi:hypothetical protein
MARLRGQAVAIAASELPQADPNFTIEDVMAFGATIRAKDEDAEPQDEGRAYPSTLQIDIPEIYVRLPDGERVLAARTPRPEGIHYAYWDGKETRFFRMQKGEHGWPHVIDVTHGISETTTTRMAATTVAGTKARTLRRRFMRKEEMDHYERTHRSGLIKPTKQTEALKTKCPIAEMFSRQSLDAMEVLAAREIGRVWETVCAGMFSKAVALGSGSKSVSDGPYWRIALAHSLRYKPWSDTLSGVKHQPLNIDEIKRILPKVDAAGLASIVSKSVERSASVYHRCPPETLSVIIDAVIEGHSCNRLDRDRGWRKGSAAKMIKAGLELYVKMAGGWIPATLDDDDLKKK